MHLAAPAQGNPKQKQAAGYKRGTRALAGLVWANARGAQLTLAPRLARSSAHELAAHAAVAAA